MAGPDFSDIADDLDNELQEVNDRIHDDEDEEHFSLEIAPDGGCRAWLIVASCSGISFLTGLVFTFFSQAAQTEDMQAAMGIDFLEAIQAVGHYDNLSDIYAAIPAVVMLYYGYKAVVLIGSIVVAVVFITLAYMGCPDGEYGMDNFFKFLILGPAAMGNSFLRQGSLIPVLEYFEKKRMRALMFVIISKYAAQLVPVIFVAIDETPDWRTFLIINAGICVVIFVLGFTLNELKLTITVRSSGTKQDATVVQKLLGLTKKTVLKSRFLWCLLIIFFFFEMGMAPGLVLFSSIPIRVSDDVITLTESLLALGLPVAGYLVGIFVAWLIRKIKYIAKRLEDRVVMSSYVLGLVTTIGIVFGLVCTISPVSTEPVLFMTAGFLFMFSYAFIEGVRDNSVPTLFSRENTRMVISMLNMSVGIGGIITGFVIEAFEEADSEVGWKSSMRFGGGILLPTGVATGVLFHFLWKIRNSANSKWGLRFPQNDDETTEPCDSILTGKLKSDNVSRTSIAEEQQNAYGNNTFDLSPSLEALPTRPPKPYMNIQHGGRKHVGTPADTNNKRIHKPNGIPPLRLDLPPVPPKPRTSRSNDVKARANCMAKEEPEIPKRLKSLKTSSSDFPTQPVLPKTDRKELQRIKSQLSRPGARFHDEASIPKRHPPIPPSFKKPPTAWNNGYSSPVANLNEANDADTIFKYGKRGEDNPNVHDNYHANPFSTSSAYENQNVFSNSRQPTYENYYNGEFMKHPPYEKVHSVGQSEPYDQDGYYADGWSARQTRDEDEFGPGTQYRPPGLPSNTQANAFIFQPNQTRHGRNGDTSENRHKLRRKHSGIYLANNSTDRHDVLY